MSDTKSAQIESVEDARSPVAGRRTRGQRVKSHCGRRWWIYLLIFILIALAVILGIIFGAIPNIAQHSVNDSTLVVDGIAIRNPSNERFTLDMNSTVHSNAPLSSHFSPQTFEMFLPASNGEAVVPFMTLDVGELDVKDVFTINVTNADTKIINKEAYDEFSKMVLMTENLNLGIRSKPQLNVGSIKFHVDYQKTVPLRGLNALRGITLTNARVLDTPQEDGTNMLTDCVIPNPSSFTLQVGDLTVDMSVMSLPLGYSVIKDLTLYPGDNHVTVSGHLNPALANNTLVIASFSQKNVSVMLTANSTVFNGEHISWLEKPLHDAPPTNATLNPA